MIYFLPNQKTKATKNAQRGYSKVSIKFRFVKYFTATYAGNGHCTVSVARKCKHQTAMPTNHGIHSKSTITSQELFSAKARSVQTNIWHGFAMWHLQLISSNFRWHWRVSLLWRWATCWEIPWSRTRVTPFSRKPDYPTGKGKSPYGPCTKRRPGIQLIWPSKFK